MIVGLVPRLENTGMTLVERLREDNERLEQLVVDQQAHIDELLATLEFLDGMGVVTKGLL